MNAALPDISLTDTASIAAPLQWVGMQGIDLPVTIAEPDYSRTLHARANVQVDLPVPDIKGIHMSRLYQILDALTDGQAFTPNRLKQMLLDMVASHDDCKSSSARIELFFQLLVRRPALVSTGLAGWRSYPAHVEAILTGNVFSFRTHVTVAYSSTCPCSAALSRQLVEQHFLEAFQEETPVAPATVAAWLLQHATSATPHSQRSEAEVSVDVAPDAPTFSFLSLIDCIEQAVATPVQTAVKRADEQAFARLNGSNLMFVEDAARRIQSALSSRFSDPLTHVRHLESLHPHDAVAWANDVTKQASHRISNRYLVPVAAMGNKPHAGVQVAT